MRCQYFVELKDVLGLAGLCSSPGSPTNRYEIVPGMLEDVCDSCYEGCSYYRIGRDVDTVQKAAVDAMR